MAIGTESFDLLPAAVLRFVRERLQAAAVLFDAQGAVPNTLNAA